MIQVWSFRRMGLNVDRINVRDERYRNATEDMDYWVAERTILNLWAAPAARHRASSSFTQSQSCYLV